MDPSDKQQFHSQKMPSAVSFQNKEPSAHSTNLNSHGASEDQDENFMTGAEDLRNMEGVPPEHFHQINLNDDSEGAEEEEELKSPDDLQASSGNFQLDANQIRDEEWAVYGRQHISISSGGDGAGQRSVGQGLMPGGATQHSSISTSNKFPSIEHGEQEKLNGHYFSLSNNPPQQNLKNNSMAGDQFANMASNYQNVFLNSNFDKKEALASDRPSHTSGQGYPEQSSAEDQSQSEDMYVQTFPASQQKVGLQSNLDIVEELKMESAQDSLLDQSRLLNNSSSQGRPQMSYKAQMDQVISDMNLQQKMMFTRHDEAIKGLKNNYVNSLEDLREISHLERIQPVNDGATAFTFLAGQQTGHFNSQEQNMQISPIQSMKDRSSEVQDSSLESQRRDVPIAQQQSREILMPVSEAANLKNEPTTVLSAQKGANSLQQTVEGTLRPPARGTTNRNVKNRTGQRPPIRSSTIDVQANENFTRKSEGSELAHSANARQMYQAIRSKSQESRGSMGSRGSKCSKASKSSQRNPSANSAGNFRTGIIRKVGGPVSKQTLRDFTAGRRGSGASSLPSSIHSNMKAPSSQQHCSDLAIKYRSLYDKIGKLFPNFQEDALKSFYIPDSLQSSDGLPAKPVFDQLNFLYDKCKNYRLDEILKERKNQEKRPASCDRALRSGSSEFDEDFASSDAAAINFLKQQIDNVQRETEYYKKQATAFKEQLQTMALQEQETETENKQKMAILNGQVQSYQEQISGLQAKVEELSDQARAKLFIENKALVEDMNAAKLQQEGAISFRGTMIKQQDEDGLKSLQKAAPMATTQNLPFSNLQSPMPARGSTTDHYSEAKSPYAQNQLSFDEQRQLFNLQNETKDLRSKLKLQEEIVGHEREQVKALEFKLEKLNMAYENERNQFDNQAQYLKGLVDQKDDTIKQLNSQIEDFYKISTLEFPVLLRREASSQPMAGANLLQPFDSAKEANLDQKAGAPKFVSMTGKRTQQQQRKVQQNADLQTQAEQDMDMLLNKQLPFGGVFADDFDDFLDTDDLKMIKNSQLPLRGGRPASSTANTAKRKQRGAALTNRVQGNSAALQHQSQLSKMLNFQSMVQSQISSVIISDQAMLEKKEIQKEKLERLNSQLDIYKAIELKIDNLMEEKKEAEEKLAKLTKDNEDLKLKFSHLLDQFQEYVNETEKKVEEEQMNQKEEQEKLFQELNSTIKELEEMSQNLQKDCEEKFAQIQTLQEEKQELEAQMDQMKMESQENGLHLEELQKVKVQSLTEEIDYLKKHYMIEMDMLRNENKSLRQLSRTRSPTERQISVRGGASLQKTYDDQDSQGQQSPYQVNQRAERMSSSKPEDVYQIHEPSSFPASNFGPLMGTGKISNQMPSQQTSIQPGSLPQQVPENGEFGQQEQRQQVITKNQSQPITFDRRGQSPVRDQHQFSVNKTQQSHLKSEGFMNIQNQEQKDLYHRAGGDNSDPYSMEREATRDYSRGREPLHQASIYDHRAASRDQDSCEVEDRKSQHSQYAYPPPRYDPLRSKSQERHGATGTSSSAYPNLGTDFRENEEKKSHSRTGGHHLSGAKDSLYNQEFGRHENERLRGEEFYHQSRHRLGDCGQSNGKRSASRHQSRDPSYERGIGKYQQDFSEENDPEAHKRAKQIIHGAQDTFDAMKKEMVEKDKQIEQKNVEIVRLRMENEELKNNDDLAVSQQKRNAILYELDHIADTLKIELDRTKLNLFKDESSKVTRSELPMHNSVKQQQSYQVVTCEDKLLSMIQDRLKGMRGLITLASEIFLLSNQHKYSKFNTEIHSQISNVLGKDDPMSVGIEQKLDRLRQDNALLQRTVYKYETTLAQLDSIFRREDTKDDVIFELKKLTEEQLHDIVKLQEDLDSLRRRLSEVEEANMAHSKAEPSLKQENHVLKQEISMLREQAARNQFLKDGNDELINERRNLEIKIDQVNSNFQEAQDMTEELKQQIEEKEKQLNDIRTKITVVAELFEKKPIRQVYGFDVLCDFIHDKAKRLFSKYDQALKEKKALKEDRHTNKRSSQVEKENEYLRDMVSLFKTVVIPRIAVVLAKPLQPHQVDSLNNSFLRELLDDLEYLFNKLKHDVSVNAQLIVQKDDRIQSLELIVEKLSNIHMPGNFTNQNTAMNTFGQGSLGGQNSSTDHLHMKSTELNKGDMDQIIKEKVKLHHKLEEFSTVLKDLQENQRTLVEENNNLKYKISQVENSRVTKHSLPSQADDDMLMSNHAQFKETLKDSLKVPKSSSSSRQHPRHQESSYRPEEYQAQIYEKHSTYEQPETYEDELVSQQIYGKNPEKTSQTMKMGCSNLTTMGMSNQNFMLDQERVSEERDH